MYTFNSEMYSNSEINIKSTLDFTDYQDFKDFKRFNPIARDFKTFKRF